MSNPTSNLVPEIGWVLLVQTPCFPLGEHHFHLDFWGNQSTVPLNVQEIIVQNVTTPHVLLDPFPPSLPFTVPSPSTVSSPSTIPSPSTVPTTTNIRPSNHISPIIGGVISGATVLIILAFLFIYQRRRSTSLQKRDNLPSPFDLDLITPFPHSQSPRKTPGTGHQGHIDSDVAETRNVESNLVTLIRQHRFQVHEDSGEQITQPADESSVVVDLPPTYNAIRFPTPPGPSVDL